jgi:hypothetical protein
MAVMAIVVLVGALPSAIAPAIEHRPYGGLSSIAVGLSLLCLVTLARAGIELLRRAFGAIRRHHRS